MASGESFTPMGASVSVAVTATAQTVMLPTYGNSTRDLDFQVVGNQAVYVRFGDANSLVTADLTTAMPLNTNNRMKMTMPRSYDRMSVIASSTGSSLFVTPGQGS